MTGCVQQAETLRQQATAQVEALEGLAVLFTQEAEHLHRRAQVRQLRSLKEKVSQDAASLRRMELAAHQGSTERKLIGAGLNFAVGSLWAAVTGRREHPLVAGARWAERALTESAPFGTVVVAVGCNGVPDDVKVVPLSRLARKSGRTEAQVEASLRADGYALMAPDAFFAVLDELQNMVLAGTLALPVAPTQLPQLPSGTGRQAP